MKEEVQLTLLGERNYLQGTTLFDACLLRTPGIRSGVFRVNHLILSDRVLLTDEACNQTSAAAQWTCRGDSGAQTIYACPLPMGIPPRRMPYDETILTSKATISEASIYWTGESPYGLSSTVVSLNKSLLHQILPQANKGRWLFVRLELTDIPRLFSEIRIVKGLDQGRKMVMSTIEVKGSPIGKLYFSWLDQ